MRDSGGIPLRKLNGTEGPFLCVSVSASLKGLVQALSEHGKKNS